MDTLETSVRSGGYTGDYTVGLKLFSDSPLTVVTSQTDQTWSSFVYWILDALHYAEEEGITQATSSKMPYNYLFGGELERSFRDAVAAVGNYGEIFERHAAATGIKRLGQNQLNQYPYQAQLNSYPGLGGSS